MGSQDCEEISQELEFLGFEYDGENKISEAFIAQTYFINTTYGLETFNFAKNDELFAIVYNIANNDFLEIIKSKLVTNEFSFAYSFKDVKFYENNKMRIGINEKSNILSFFVALK
ncbi:hypothetical protein [Mesonia sp. K7]|uniref:hypothetical protein n=1 Tax=Mesonia sp. K7 TaxID=2218606 RepID=UPI0011B579F8|nr:hypothetical protein [Mesonia sp. K7]